MTEPESQPDPSVPAAVAANPPFSLDAVTLNAGRYDERRDLLLELNRITQEIDDLDTKLGLNKVRLCQGDKDNGGEYLCDRCGLDWFAVEKMPCVNCFPIRLISGNRPGVEHLYNLPGMDAGWQEATADVLRLHALKRRSEAVSAPMRLSREKEEVDGIVAKLREEADEIEVLSEGIRAGELRNCRWIPLDKAKVFNGRLYLLSAIDSQGYPVGPTKLCRLDSSLGWIAESLDGVGDDFLRRETPGSAVFILPGHP